MYAYVHTCELKCYICIYRYSHECSIYIYTCMYMCMYMCMYNIHIDTRNRHLTQLPSCVASLQRFICCGTTCSLLVCSMWAWAWPALIACIALDMKAGSRRWFHGEGLRFPSPLITAAFLVQSCKLEQNGCRDHQPGWACISKLCHEKAAF